MGDKSEGMGAKVRRRLNLQLGCWVLTEAGVTWLRQCTHRHIMHNTKACARSIMSSRASWSSFHYRICRAYSEIVIGSGGIDRSGDRKKASKGHSLAGAGRDRTLAMVTGWASPDGRDLCCEGQPQEVEG